LYLISRPSLSFPFFLPHPSCYLLYLFLYYIYIMFLFITNLQVYSELNNNYSSWLEEVPLCTLLSCVIVPLIGFNMICHRINPFVFLVSPLSITNLWSPGNTTSIKLYTIERLIIWKFQVKYLVISHVVKFHKLLKLFLGKTLKIVW
jgi:hypothetical protein